MSERSTDDRSAPPHRSGMLVRAAGFLLGALVTIVVALALFIRFGFDAAQIETDFTDFAENNYQRTLQIDGGVHLALWPWPTLRIGHASLSEPDGKTAFIAWNAARFELDAWALLRKRIEIQHVRIDGLNLHLARDAKGEWNTHDLLDDKASADAPFSLQLEGLSIKAASVIIDDARKDFDIRLRNLEIGSDALQARRGGRLQLSAQIISPSPALSGRVGLSTRYRLGDAPGSGMLASTKLDYAGSIGSENSISLAGSIESIDWQDGGWSLINMQAQAQSQSAPPAEYELLLPQAAWRKGLNATSITARYKQSEDHTAQISLQDLKGSPTGARAQLGISWHARDGDTVAEGRAHGPLIYADKASPTTPMLSIAGLEGELQLSHSALRAKTAKAQIDGNVAWGFGEDAQTPPWKFDLRFDIVDVGKLRSQGSLARGPVIRTRLDVPQFDVDRLVAAGHWREFMPAAHILHGWSLEADMRATSITAGGVRIDALDTPIRLDKGRLSLPDHVLQLYGGKLNGSLEWDGTSHRLRVFEAMREVRLDQLQDDAKFRLPLAGLTNATLDFTSEGEDLSTLCSKADGVLRVYAKNARWVGVDLSRSLKELKPGASRTPDAKESTPLNELSAAFSLTDSELAIDKLTARSDTLALTGEGSFGCNDASMDMLTRIRVGNDRSLPALRGKTVAVRVKGKMRQPVLELVEHPPKPAQPTQKQSVPAAEPAAPTLR